MFDCKFESEICFVADLTIRPLQIFKSSSFESRGRKANFQLSPTANKILDFELHLTLLHTVVLCVFCHLIELEVKKSIFKEVEGNLGKNKNSERGL